MSVSGIINLDKSEGDSSARALYGVKRCLPRKTKVGHAGTLDPFATGVLVVLIGAATKTCEMFMSAPKQYVATIHFGATTPTDDPTETATPWPGEVIPVEREQLLAQLPALTGTIVQRPPAFSALKVGGRRAYDLARNGQEVALSPRLVKVYALELLSYEWPLATLRIDCGRGTYVRAIARDLGEALNVGAYLGALRRTRVGPFSVSSGVTVDQLRTDGLTPHLQPVPDLSTLLDAR
jgi:tRNA pseudouridine55 synthase